MADTSRPLVPSRDSRLTPEAISARDFTQVKRGYSESEVRAYLRMVADELASVAGRERDLGNRVRSLEERLAAPKPPPSDQDLITQLGEETARVLGQAREAAVELRAKAEEHARRLVREAQESARELRTATQQAVETKTREAEDAARARAKDIVGEARTMRERVLADLNERRADLERQVNDLRASRGRLVETYEVVERALTQATRLMAEDPGATSTSPPVAPAPPILADAPAPASDAPDADAAAPTVARDDANASPAVAPEPNAAEPPADDANKDAGSKDAVKDAESKDVGALFEKLRSGGEDESTDAAPDAEADTPNPDAPKAEEAAEAVADDAGTTDADDEADDEEADEPDEVPLEGDAALLHARDVALATVADDLGRRAKRAVQDEQNDVLDGLRRQRGKIDTTKVLPPLDEQLARWAHVLQPAADAAYAAGAASVGGKGGNAAPSGLLGELADFAVTPLRGRLVDSLAAVDTRTPADTELAIAQALGARYREWRTQDLDVVLGDVLAVSYARGAYDAVPDGTKLRWVPAREGKCPDCDDNALEATPRGEAFPTGQTFPPAHPGCRCLLVLDAPNPS